MTAGRTAPTLAVLLMGVALAAGGCGGMTAGPPSPLPRHAEALETWATTYAPGRVAECLGLAVDQQRQCRDTISYALMTAIDLRYGEFEAEFLDQTRYGGFAATLVTLGLTGAGSVVTGSGAANILSAAATAVTGGREAFSREILAERTATALMTAMRAERARLALRIRGGLRQDPAQYPLGWALSDLFAYYRAGTIPGALTTVTREVGASAERSQDNLTIQTLEGFTPVEVSAGRVTLPPGESRSGRVVRVAPGIAQTSSREVLRHFMGLDGSLDDATRRERIRAVAATMARLGITGVLPAGLVNRPEPAFEADRLRVIEALRNEGRIAR